MSGLCAKKEEIVEIIRGEDKVITVKLQDEEGLPVPLTGVTEIECLFLQDDGTALHKKLTDGDITLVNEPGGVFAIALIPAETQAMKLSEDGQYSSFESRYTIAGILTYVQHKNSLNIKASLFPVGA